MAKSSLEKFLTRLRVAVAVILLAIVIIALAVYLGTPPTPAPNLQRAVEYDGYKVLPIRRYCG